MSPYGFEVFVLGFTFEVPDPLKSDPGWSPLVIDSRLPFQNGPRTLEALNAEIPSTTILEGVIPAPPIREKSGAQAPSEVSEQEVPWTHFSHDKTFQVVPDLRYESLLTTFADWTIENRYTSVEVEWENGALPLFVWPSVGDRVWVQGRWVFDCGHLGVRKTGGDLSLAYDANINGVFDESDRAIARARPQLGDHLSLDLRMKYFDRNNNGRWDPMNACLEREGPILGSRDVTLPASLTALNESIVFDPNDNNRYDPGEPVLAGPAPRIGDRLADDPGITFVDGVKQVCLLGACSLDVTPCSIGCPLSKNGVFDHEGAVQSAFETRDNVRFAPEIHPARALVTYRIGHTAALSYPALPVTGLEALPLTQADIFVSGNGGYINDYCSMISRHAKVDLLSIPDILSPDIDHLDSCDHTGPFLPVNDTNYVFDIYPPGTDYSRKTCSNDRGRECAGDVECGSPDAACNFQVTPPKRDDIELSLQALIIDRSDEIPSITRDAFPFELAHALLCPIDEHTKSPSPRESRCPAVPPNPTRLRVILPFEGTSATAFAATVILAWDDVPPSSFVRTFEVVLHEFRIDENGTTGPGEADWRVYADVGGRWQYLTETPAHQTPSCASGDLDLKHNGDEDCYAYECRGGWELTVNKNLPIHVAIGGWRANDVEANFCALPQNPPGCDMSGGALGALALHDGERIGTLEFDVAPPDYDRLMTDGAGNPIGSVCSVERRPMPVCGGGTFGDELAVRCDSFGENQSDDREVGYSVTFGVQEKHMVGIVPTVLTVGTPLHPDVPNPDISSGSTFVTSRTPLTLRTNIGGVTNRAAFQYRFFRDGTEPPSFPTLPLPTRWLQSGFDVGSASGFTFEVFLNSFDGVDGAYRLEYSAQLASHPPEPVVVLRTEPRHLALLKVDNTPPTISIIEPRVSEYLRSATVTLNYTLDDGMGSGVGRVTPLMEGASTSGGHGLESGQRIKLRKELSVGPHTFRVDGSDNLGNASSSSVKFEVVGHRWISGMVGGQFFDVGSQSSDRARVPHKGLAVGLRYEHHLTTRWGVEGSFSYSSAETAPFYGRARSLDGYYYAGTAVFKLLPLLPTGRVVPLVSAGIGGIRIGARGGARENAFAFNFGTGIAMQSKRRIGIRLDARDYLYKSVGPAALSLGTSRSKGLVNDLSINLGLFFVF